MTIYDALMLLIVIVAILQGAWRGMTWQLAPIASLVLGYLVSYPMSITAAQYFGKPPLNRLWAMIAIYLAVSLAVYMVVRSIRHSLEQVKLVEFDRHLGAILGGVKGVLFTVVLTVGLVSVSAQAREIILKSESSTISARLMNTISPILPKPVNDLVAPYVKTLNDHLPEIADNPTYSLPIPPVLIPNRSANQQSLSRPKRFDQSRHNDTEFDDSRNQGRDPFGAPDQNDPFAMPDQRQPSRTQPARNQPGQDFPDFPERIGTNRNDRLPVNSQPSNRTAPDFPDDEFAPPLPTRPNTPPATRENLPPVPPEDDFFGADPDAALKKLSSQPR